MPQTCFSIARPEGPACANPEPQPFFLDPWIRNRSKIIPEARAGDAWVKKLKAGAAEIKKLAGSQALDIYVYKCRFFTLHYTTLYLESPDTSNRFFSGARRLRSPFFVISCLSHSYFKNVFYKLCIIYTKIIYNIYKKIMFHNLVILN